jgi:hypothetical protein
MYQKPRLQRFGTFRELTLFGLCEPDTDGGSVYGLGGHWQSCEVVPNGEGGGS